MALIKRRWCNNLVAVGVNVEVQERPVRHLEADAAMNTAATMGRAVAAPCLSYKIGTPFCNRNHKMLVKIQSMILEMKDGILTFWKGAIGSCVVWGLSNVTEIVLADLFGLPRSTFFAMTPFLISAFTETVRSEAGLGGEGPNVMEVLFKGVDRLRFPIFGARDPSRRFSILHLALPTVAYRTSHYIIQTKLHYQFFKMARKYVNKKPESERTKFHQYVPQIFAQMSSTILTDLILFPFETIMHRMYIQGLPGILIGVFQGVGALALEYLLHSLLHQAVRACFDRGSEVLRRATESNPNITPVPSAYGGSYL
ncbi:hypothetical protein TELCIR_01145 [Teladorsagia circumcincta]|uniref:Uncharacterized protein n=1 Tax=Teladorsagia circumcincta TaxID=45464 RepID=A0A2G9V4V5_TELCI|nr:hypothetical protein TELCIR_01145 [Teladorsagia circumcincta]